MKEKIKCTFSIIIGTYNRADDLYNCLKSVLKNTSCEFEIIIIDQSDNSQSQLVVSTFNDGRIRYYRILEKNLSKAHNLGITKSKGENIVFLDDDCIVSNKWLSQYRSYLQRYPQVAGFFGTTMPYRPELHHDQICPATIEHKRLIFISDPYINYHVVLGQANNMCLRLSTAHKVGFFNERLGPGTKSKNGDDSEYIYRVLKKGMILSGCPGATAYHNKWTSFHEEKQLQLGYSCGWISFATYQLLLGDIQAIRLIGLKVHERFMVNTQLSDICRELLCFTKGLVFGVRIRINSPKFA